MAVTGCDVGWQGVVSGFDRIAERSAQELFKVSELCHGAQPRGTSRLSIIFSLAPRGGGKCARQVPVRKLRQPSPGKCKESAMLP